ncbi:NAD(P)-dependent oxidoreductase [Nocardia xishanensis]
MSPQPVTVAGLGPMGQALASAFLRAGAPVTVWNRTPSRADALVDRGAHRAPDITVAVRSCDLIVVCLIDDDAVTEVLEPVAAELRGKTLVNLTSTTPRRSRARADWAQRHGIGYLDGAILTPTPTIGGPDAVVLYSGPASVYDTHRATLVALGEKSIHVGEDAGRAAGYDTAVLSLFWISVLGVVHSLAFAKAEGITGTDLLPYASAITGLLPEMLQRFGEQVETGRYPGERSTIASAAAGLTHLTHTAASHHLDTAVLHAALGTVRTAVDAGHSGDGLARLVPTIAAPATAITCPPATRNTL